MADDDHDEHGQSVIWVRCKACAHEWIACYLPMDVDLVVKVLRQDRCPHTLTVEQARQALEEAIIENSAQVRCNGAYPTLIPTARVDALIAAVRAEPRVPAPHDVEVTVVDHVRGAMLAAQAIPSSPPPGDSRDG